VRIGFLVLTLCLACGDAGSRSPQVIAADTAVGFSGGFSPDQLQAYERGRRKEIAELRSGGQFTIGTIDSIGARAAGLSPEDYQNLTQTIAGLLKQRTRLLSTQMTLAPAVNDSLFALLDSLRVERLVLEVRIGR
jgi:hypothetical protein